MVTERILVDKSGFSLRTSVSRVTSRPNVPATRPTPLPTWLKENLRFQAKTGMLAATIAVPPRMANPSWNVWLGLLYTGSPELIIIGLYLEVIHC